MAVAKRNEDHERDRKQLRDQLDIKSHECESVTFQLQERTAQLDRITLQQRAAQAEATFGGKDVETYIVKEKLHNIEIYLNMCEQVPKDPAIDEL